ncbi:hypothetical protein HVIM_00750 [Roseomonas mucosa]|uniref:Hydrogenase 4 membrane subunit n=1 Tax=Roseomonas mucosa TaxID=207340 RepID=A0A1S8D7I8_9PROT|nr:MULTISPECIES: hypothetical protein [Roseomonas]MBS5903089.1 hypothetical protein [Acetobacteraceae bacterium]MCG7352034.1 hypothetical protein [Roseomonas mucosa]MCG7356558.1 hypothetical protein [Roseomonas mucosa]MDT8289079.1 hypothetical protein [Roseomonas mucosa]MDT8296219.1 hypothetical protein [Roseomonas mucosa]
MRFEPVSADLPQLLAGGMLLCGFALLCLRRSGGAILAYALQSLLLALLAGWLARSGSMWRAELLAVATVALLGRALAVPLGLRRLSRRLGLPGEAALHLGIGSSLILGTVLLGFATVVVWPAAMGAGGMAARATLAVALALLLLGLATVLLRRDPLSQGLGILSLENGLVLAALAVPGLPEVLELTLASLILALAMVAGAFLFHLRFELAAWMPHGPEGGAPIEDAGSGKAMEEGT